MGRARKVSIPAALFLVTIITTSCIFPGCFDKDEDEPQWIDDGISFKIGSFKDIRSYADPRASNWSTDSVLFGSYGCEFSKELNQDLHPAMGVRVLAPADEEPMDGSCHYWKFLYYSASKGSYFSLVLDGEGNDIYTEREIEMKFKDAWYHQNLSNAVDTSELKMEKIDLTKDYVPSFSPINSAIVYWLNYDMDVQGPVWTVYHADRDGIRSSAIFDGANGDLIEANSSTKDISFHEALNISRGVEVVRSSSLLVVEARSDEISSINPNFISFPTIRNGYLIPPDIGPADGRFPYWELEFNGPMGNPELEMVLWASGEYAVIELNRINEVDIFPGDLNYSRIVDSTAAANMSRKEACRTFDRFFSMDFSVFTYDDYHPYKWESRWNIRYSHSPDALGSTSVNGFID